MTVSFTGINNLKISKKLGQDTGAYPAHNSNIKIGHRNFEHIKYNFTLTNDAKGQDMKELQDSFKKSGRNYCYNPQNPNQVEFEVKRFDIDDDVAPIKYSVFRMNGQNISILNKKDMILYTHLAKLTKKLGQLPDISPAQKKYTELANQSIHEEAVNFIENVM